VPEPTEADTVILPPPKTSSLLDALRARRAEMLDEQTTDLLVPGYNGMLALRVGPLTGREQSRLTSRMAQSKSPDREATYNADTLITATRELVVRNTEGEPWQSLGSLNGGDPVGIDDRLVELLDLKPAALTARATLRALFALAPSPDIAINLASAEYITWAGGITEDVDADYVGE
jgi:hypothetical protein